QSDAPLVTALVQRLLDELGGFTTGDDAEMVALCERLLASDHHAAFLAVSAGGDPLGVVTVAECMALYVAGRLGWVQELYVVPEARSSQVGHALIAAVTAYGQERHWQRLEVNTPNVGEWPRTVAFYRHEGFIGESLHLRKQI